VRSWIHYLQLRTDPSTQLEHRELALDIKDVFVKQFPQTAAAAGFNPSRWEC
jgi:thymidylate synthase (FAD)